MKNPITARLTMPSNIFLENGGLAYLQRMIDSVAEDLAEEHGYTSIEYIDHHLEEGYLDSSEDDKLVFVFTFGVGLINNRSYN